MQIAVSHKPTTVLFIDDRIVYLDDLTVQLHDLIAFKTFSQPQKAIQYLSKYKQKPLTQQCIFAIGNEKIDEDNLSASDIQSHAFVDIDTTKLIDAIYTNDRFKEISVIVIDYAMPIINGLELAEKIRSTFKELPIKILMLTGQADSNTAIKAFNEKKIDRFLFKDEPDLITQLNNTLFDLQKEYSQDLSNTIINNLLLSNLYCCLKDSAFIQIFGQICNKHNIIEYYLIDTTGSFLMLNSSGKQHWLIVKTEKNMRELDDLVRDEDAPSDIIKAISSRKFLMDKIIDQPLTAPETAADWRRYLHPASSFERKKCKYYYSFLDDGTARFNIKPNKIASYENYLKQI